MSLQDSISDMLTRIRNASAAYLGSVEMPASKLKLSVASVMKEEGYISDFSETGSGVSKQLVLKMKYYRKKPVIEGLKRVSKPSCRIYCGSSDIPKVRNGFGTVILSTPKGVMSGRKAVSEKVGGEIICIVW
jgi:small subunit ribosomal protein S8